MDCICKDDNPTFCAALRNKEPIAFNLCNNEEAAPQAAPLNCPCRCHSDKFYIREHLAQQITARHFQHKRTASCAERTNRLSARVDREDILY